MKMKQ